ncbi:MAG: hypothetical protein V3T05_07935, partial [Myxococcota bacterium]
PPAMPPKLPPGPYQGRMPFEELFASESAPMPAATGTPQEKVAYFREKLRRMEEKVSSFKQAWTTRESEMDALEALVKREQKRAEEADNQFEVLQDFITRKKAEMDQYGKQVTAAFSEKDAAETQLRAEVEKIRAEGDKEREELYNTLESFDQDLIKRNEAIRRLKATIKLQRDTVEARNKEIQDAKDRSEEGREELLSGLKSVNRDLADRDAMIRKLEATSSAQQHLIEAREEQVQKLASKVKTASAVGSGGDELEEAIIARNLKLAKYKKALQGAKSEIHRLQLELSSKKRELDEAQRHGGGRGASHGAPDSWDQADNLAQLEKATSIAERLLSELEIRTQQIFDDVGVRSNARRHVEKLMTKLGKAIALIQKAARLI